MSKNYKCSTWVGPRPGHHEEPYASGGHEQKMASFWVSIPLSSVSTSSPQPRLFLPCFLSLIPPLSCLDSFLFVSFSHSDFFPLNRPLHFLLLSYRFCEMNFQFSFASNCKNTNWTLENSIDKWVSFEAHPTSQNEQTNSHNNFHAPSILSFPPYIPRTGNKLYQLCYYTWKAITETKRVK